MLSFPRPLAEFANLLGIQEINWNLNVYQTTSGQQSGAIWGVQNSPSLWAGQVKTKPHSHEVLSELLAELENLSGVFNTFYISDPRFRSPIGQPPGSLGASIPFLFNVETNNQEIGIKGLPSLYELRKGSYLSFDYDNGRRAFHRVVDGGISNGAGELLLVQVTPNIRSGYITGVGTPITLEDPAIKAFLTTGKYKVNQESLLHNSIVFNFTQSLRVV